MRIGWSLKAAVVKFGLIFGAFSSFFWSLEFGLAIGLLAGLGYGLSGGLFFGMFGGLIINVLGGRAKSPYGGLVPAIQHFVLRLVLNKNGYIPWDYEKFLEHAVKHRFIQRTGGRYRFIHPLLGRHFAQMTPQQQKAITQKS